MLALEQERGYKTNVLQVKKGFVVEINSVLSVVLKRESSVVCSTKATCGSLSIVLRSIMMTSNPVAIFFIRWGVELQRLK